MCAEISEAFEVLSDAKKKKMYDQFGEAGLGASGGYPAGDDGNGGGGGGGMPFGATGGASPFGSSSHFSFSRTGGGGGRGGFQGSDPFSVFEAFFGTGNVNEGAFFFLRN